jgi:hypothetical protein
MTHATIEEGYNWAKNTISNVHEHIPVLETYAQKCGSVAELGIGNMITTWGLLKGLRFNKKKVKKLYCVDLNGKPSSFEPIAELAKKNRITMEFTQGDSRSVSLPMVDMLFIDTTHHYGLLMKELEHHHKRVKKYIVMHNTEIDKDLSEIVRMCYYYDIDELQKEYSIKDLVTGLGPAIEDFLKAHQDWKVLKHLPNNNGLTILARADLEESDNERDIDDDDDE